MAKKKAVQNKESNLFYADKAKYMRALKEKNVKEAYERFGGKFNEGYGYMPLK